MMRCVKAKNLAFYSTETVLCYSFVVSYACSVGKTFREFHCFYMQTCTRWTTFAASHAQRRAVKMWRLSKNMFLKIPLLAGHVFKCKNIHCVTWPKGSILIPVNRYTHLLTKPHLLLID